MNLLTIEEVAVRIRRKAIGTVYSLMNRDPSFPRAIKLGRNVFWLTEDIDAWLDAQIQGVRAENKERLEQAKGPQPKK